MALTMVILPLIVFVATAACEYHTAMATPSDYVYPYYALRYVSLGDYKQQSNLGAYNTADQQGYLRYVTYMTDGSNIYRTIIRMKPGSNPAPTWARLPIHSTNSQVNRDITPTSAKLSSQDTRNQGLLETSTTQPSQGRSNDAIESSTISSLPEKSNQINMYPAEVLAEPPVQEKVHHDNYEPYETSEILQDKSTNDEASQELQSEMQQQKTNKEEIHTSEDSVPSTTTKNTENGEEKEEVSTLVPFPDDLSINNEENAEMVGEESRESKIVEVPQEKEELSGNDLTAAGTFTPHYISTPYGPVAVYPLGYRQYTNQRRQMIRPMSGSQNPPVYPTTTTSTERNPSKIMTTAPTINPTIVGSSLPSLGYSTGSPMQISYAYPYMRYNGQGTVMYQLPQQQYKTNQQFLGWPGVSQSSYQSTYPQGYMSYQPSVLAVRSVPYTQTGIKVKQ